MKKTASSWSRIIAHADMDAFYAAVEQLDRPELKGQPLLIGPPSGRGVVLTASYEARPYGVGSAMPMVQALRKCPHALIVPPRFERYSDVSATIMDVFEDFSPCVEAISLDEAFIDLSGSGGLLGSPEQMGRKIKAAVYEATGGLTISVGISHTKYVAKVASAFQKPDGLTIVPASGARGWLAPLSVSRLWGAGPKTQARLARLGYHCIGDIAATSPELLARDLGSLGQRFHRLANAEDPRPVKGHRANRSIGSERTLATDITARVDIISHLRRSAHRIARRLRGKGWHAGGVRVRLKTSDFQLITRQCTLAEPSDTADELLAAGVELLDRFNHKGPFRLVGMAAHSLIIHTPPRQLSFLDAAPERRRLEVTLDRLSERFGEGAVVRAKDLNVTTVIDTTPNLDFLQHDEHEDPPAQ